MGRRLAVRVPATTANLGSGFDCVGMAFDWYDELTVEVLENPGVVVEVTGEGAGQVPRDERHLVVSSILRGLDAFGVEPPGMRLTSHNTIPHSRGLGSSAAAIVAGLALAWGIAKRGEPLDPAVITRLATDVERFEGLVELHVVPPLCPVRVSPVDFSRSAELIDRSLNSTRHWLPTDRTGTRQSEVLEFHRD